MNFAIENLHFKHAAKKCQLFWRNEMLQLTLEMSDFVIWTRLNLFFHNSEEEKTTWKFPPVFGIDIITQTQQLQNEGTAKLKITTLMPLGLVANSSSVNKFKWPLDLYKLFFLKFWVLGADQGNNWVRLTLISFWKYWIRKSIKRITVQFFLKLGPVFHSLRPWRVSFYDARILVLDD